MRPIDKFILHVVHNLFPLNEYSEGELKRLMTQFREEADDYNINISDETLKKYIERFDQIKNSPKIQEKDLRKYSLSKLIKLVTSSAGVDTDEEEEDRTPDMVYQDGGITIWNGAKQGNCITYGASQKLPGGSQWCITQPGGSYWGRYRFGQEYGYPTFYLAKNNNLSDSNKLSFVALQVLQDGSYKFTNRNNSPGMEGPFSWEELNSKIPWLRDIPNLKNILKYIPFSKSEKANNVWRENPITIKQWKKEPFNNKKQYLIVRAGNRSLFKDISNEIFISKYLPQYPQIASIIAGTTGIIDIETLMNYLDKFSKQDQLSIAKQIRDKFKLDILDKDIEFDLKKYLVKTDKINIRPEQRLYITKDNSTIVLLTLGDNVKVGLYNEEDEYPDIKLNQRTSKYLLDYPELDKIPFNVMIKLTSDGVIDRSLLNTVIEKAKSEENSAIVVKDVDGKEIIVDSNSFASYKIEDGKITKIPFNDEDVQKVFAAEKENTSFQQGAVDVIKTAVSNNDNLPPTLDKEAFISIIKATPYDKRQYVDNNRNNVIILTPDGESNRVMFVKNIDPYNSPFNTRYDFGYNGEDWRRPNYNNSLDEGAWRAYFAWMRNENMVYESDQVIRMWRNTMSTNSKKAWFRAQPPFSPTDRYAPAIGANGINYLINKANPRESLKLSDSGKLIKANIPSALARQLLGGGGAAPEEIPQDIARRRGRPAGGGQRQAAAPAAPAAGGDINVTDVMTETGLDVAFMRLPRADYRRLNVTDAVRVNPNGDRGAARVNNRLRNAGRVGRVLGIGPSKIYIIRLANQQIIASINIQPGNRNYVLMGNEQGNVMIPMNSPSELMQVLQQRNLAEVRNYLVREFVANNPQHIDEVRELIQKHIAEIKNQ